MVMKVIKYAGRLIHWAASTIVEASVFLTKWAAVEFVRGVATYVVVMKVLNTFPPGEGSFK